MMGEAWALCFEVSTTPAKQGTAPITQQIDEGSLHFLVIIHELPGSLAEDVGRDIAAADVLSRDARIKRPVGAGGTGPDVLWGGGPFTSTVGAAVSERRIIGINAAARRGGPASDARRLQGLFQVETCAGSRGTGAVATSHACAAPTGAGGRSCDGTRRAAKHRH